MANSALIDDLRKQFAENPRRVFARLANEYRKRGELDSAIEICRTHVPLQPGYISGHIVLGQALYDSGSLDEARTTFETALALDPENLIALRHMGDIARANGDVAGARAWYRQLLEIDPQNDEVGEQIESLGAAGAESAATDAAPQEEARGWGEVDPGAIELDVEGAVADAAEGHTEAAQAHEADPEEALVVDAPGPDADGEAGAAPEPIPAVEGLEVTSEFDRSAADAAPLELVDMDELAPEDDDATAFGEAVEPRPTPRAAPPLYPPDPFGESAFDSVDETPAPSAFATETMAELYLQQGLTDRALTIYRDLAARNPEDTSLRDRVAELEEASAVAPEPTASTGKSSRTAREFFGVLAYRRAPHVASTSASASEPASELFPGDGAAVSEEDEGAAAALAEAFIGAGEDAAELASLAPVDAATSEEISEESSAEVDAVGQAALEDDVAIETPPSAETIDEYAAGDEVESASRVEAMEAPVDEQALDASDVNASDAPSSAPVESQPGRPGREASDALSLDEVFRDNSARGDSRRESGVSFDEFFARRENGAAAESSNGAVAKEEKEASANGNRSTDDAPQDLELFHAWLDGLKS